MSPCLLAAVVSCIAVGAPLDGVVRVLAEGQALADSAGVVISLEGGGGAVAPSSKKVMAQHDKQFSPQLLVVVRGTVVSFPNDDSIFHNVFSLSRGAAFDLGLYRAGESKSVRFSKPGVVDVFCNIHPEMVAKIKVVDSPYYDVTKQDGRFHIDAPPGTYTLAAWSAQSTDLRMQLNLDATETREPLQITLQRRASSTAHTRKDGTPYGRYK